MLQGEGARCKLKGHSEHSARISPIWGPGGREGQGAGKKVAGCMLQGSQIRRSSKSIKDQIVEGYGRRRYKADYIKFLVYAHSSCDETTSQLEMLIATYPELLEFQILEENYKVLGRKIYSFIEYVEKNWRT
jgi:four helix bundle protein